jgi:4-amino-4-deoxy-L-arabinose transferase-like glycosyltransferase
LHWKILIANKWEIILSRLKSELNRRTALPVLFLGIFVYFFVSYLFASTEFYRISYWSVGRSAALNAIFTFNVTWVLSTFSLEIYNSWFKQIVYQGIAGGITGSFIKEEVKSSIAICSATLSFYAILVLSSNIPNMGMIILFLIKGLLIGVVGGVIGIRFYKEISEEHTKNEE